MGPGGLHMDNQYNATCVGGASGYIDRVVLGSNHIYGNPTPKPVYGSGPYDPEGILGKLFLNFKEIIVYFEQFLNLLKKHFLKLQRQLIMPCFTFNVF